MLGATTVSSGDETAATAAALSVGSKSGRRIEVGPSDRSGSLLFALQLPTSNRALWFALQLPTSNRALA